MSRKRLGQIRDKVRLRQYDMSAHAAEEMAEDDLDILDIEHAVLNGQIVRIEKDDLRGIKYVIEGTGMDQMTSVGVVGRFTGADRYLIITVYQVTEPER